MILRSEVSEKRGKGKAFPPDFARKRTSQSLFEGAGFIWRQGYCSKKSRKANFAFRLYHA